MHPITPLIVLNRDSKIAVYKQISFAIANAIRHGLLKAGDQIPGSRELAQSLMVHRKTVVAAYDELDAQGWIRVLPRKRIRVSEQIPTLEGKKWKFSEPENSYELTYNFSFNTSLSSEPVNERLTAPELVIDDGHPDIRLSPIDTLLKTYRSYTKRNYAIKNANLGNSQGTLALRSQLADYLGQTRGLTISAENLLITHGAQMCIYLAAQLLLNPTTTIVIGRPNYPAANQVFTETGSQIIEIPVDENGMQIDQLEAVCKAHNVTAVYIIPHHHYPTTATLSVHRRMELLSLSQIYSFVIIEDDYDFDYHYDSAPYLPLASAKHEGNVVYMGSFSKILGPSMRIGFMVATRNFIEQCMQLRKLIDIGNDIYMQNALASLITDGELSRHLKKARKIYKNRMLHLDGLLKTELKGLVSYTIPTGGMALWVKLLPSIPVRKIKSLPQLEIIRVDLNENAFRFGFASLSEEELSAAVQLLKGFCNAYLKQPSA
ncbi:MocR-like pyridoxine biosynthesis transcription factor PdxR [Pedobacter ureilyticus]|uniref:PLP-dependent aminotransferase family protein n=1 Tax=Pedobacter ureilyticus TaxID=1393051 RepID=A0ABW9JCJ7_9SPHI|nr:PLP-dependent aminotransferase family protein [Pedobacter helvus]